MTEVSVIIPCYNAGNLVLSAIKSVREQTFRNIEIIVVNDGSDDPYTLKVLKRIQSNIKIITQKNKGLSSARNTGIREANGKYILPLDSDDYIDPSFIEKAIETLKKSTECSYVFFNINTFGEKECILDRNYNYFVQLFNNQLPYCIFFKKSLWDKIGGYDEDMKLGYEDWEFNIRLGKYGFHPKKNNGALFNYYVSYHGMLFSKSDKNYISIVRGIRKKHRDIYNISELYRIWKAWRYHPMPFPTILYFFMYIATEFLPGNLYNHIYSRLTFLRQSVRLSRLNRWK